MLFLLATLAYQPTFEPAARGRLLGGVCTTTLARRQALLRACADEEPLQIPQLMTPERAGFERFRKRREAASKARGQRLGQSDSKPEVAIGQDPFTGQSVDLSVLSAEPSEATLVEAVEANVEAKKM